MVTSSGEASLGPSFDALLLCPSLTQSNVPVPGPLLGQVSKMGNGMVGMDQQGE